ncbi:MAG: urea carboxylase-associated family protein [Dongiaceae bacterium]
MPQTVTIAAATGHAVDVPKGRRIRITTPAGSQAADFFAYRADNLAEWLSPMHSWVASRSVRPRAGDTFLSCTRRPLLDFVEDGAGGIHDMMIAACDQARYEQFGHKGHHRSCSENLQTAMQARGHEIAVIPQPVNFFTNTRVEENHKLVSPPNPVAPGSYVVLEAKADLICVVSSCPFDLKVPGWTINADRGPSELIVEVD